MLLLAATIVFQAEAKPAGRLAFEARIEHALPGPAECALACDLDGDGRREVVVPLRDDGTVWIGTASAASAPFTASGESAGAWPLRPGALRGWRRDSKAELLAIASRSARTVAVLDLGSQDGRRRRLATHQLESVPRALATGDLDGDGVDEIAVASDGKSLLLVRGNGAMVRGELAFDTPRCASIAPGAVFVGDVGAKRVERFELDANGTLAARGTIELTGLPRDLAWRADELFVANGGGSVERFARVADAWEPRAALTCGRVPIRLVSAGLIGDAFGVLAFAGASFETFELTAEAPRTARKSTYVGQTPTDVALADLDRDASRDLVVVNRDAHAASVVKGRGTGFAFAPEAAVGAFPTCVRGVRWNGETFVVAASAKDHALSFVAQRDGAWREAKRIELARSPRALVRFDLDGDGEDELVLLTARDAEGAIDVYSRGERVASLEVPGGVVALCGVRNASSAAHLVASDAESGALLTLSVRRGRRFELAQTKRTRLDGAPGALAEQQGDVLAVALPARREIVVVQGDVVLQRIPCKRTPRDLVVADFDGDGIDDLAVLTRDEGDAASSQVETFLRGKSPSILPPVRCGANALRLAAGDGDGDRRAEVFVAAQDAHRVDVLRPGLVLVGQTANARTVEPSLGLGLAPLDVDVFDFDGDGAPDVLSANSAGDSVSFARNVSR